MATGTIATYAALAPRGILTPHRLTLGTLAAHDVEIAVEACALCHSDVHLIDDDWGISRYPLVPGHEAVGRVVAVGSAVTALAPGDRAGVGWQRAACGDCAQCRAGYEQLCPLGKRRTCVDQSGGFAERVRTHERFAFRIPDSLTSAEAAPLLCAGVTVYSPLTRQFGASARGKRVGVVGIGGLGHLAVQFAAKMGATVVAFDPDASKADEARRLGAAEFAEPLEAAGLARCGGLDFILCTAAADLDWNLWLGQLALNGTLCLVGVPAKPLAIQADHLLDGQKAVTGSVVGSPATMRAMLEFAAAHRVVPMIEVLPMSEVNVAVGRVRAGLARYRMVLTNG